MEALRTGSLQSLESGRRSMHGGMAGPRSAREDGEVLLLQRRLWKAVEDLSRGLLGAKDQGLDAMAPRPGAQGNPHRPSLLLMRWWPQALTAALFALD